MNNSKWITIRFLAAAIICWAKVSDASPLGTAFTYQGHLYDSNHAANETYDFKFRLYDANSGGAQKGNDVNIPDVDVIDGRFAVTLDFGSVFDGNELWLDIGVRPGVQNDPYPYSLLSPRQKLTPAPYALYAFNSGGPSGESPWQTNGINIYYGNGNVGIGTTSPSTKLHVSGVITSTGGNSSNWNTAYSHKTAEDLINGLVKCDGSATYSAVVDNSTNWNVAYGWGNHATAGYLKTESDPQVSSVTANRIPKWNGATLVDGKIYDNGNVGIGTSSPTAMLHISKNATASPSTHPQTKMIIEDGDSDAYLQIMAPPANTRALLFGESGAGGQVNDGMIGYNNSNGMTFRVDRSNNDLMPLILQMNGNVIMSEGNVGIGTSTPSEKLEVAASIKTSGDYKYSSRKTYYKNIPPHAFHPKSNKADGVEYEIDDYVGSLNITAISGLYKTVYLVAPVDLPQGAVVTKLTYIYYDSSVSEGLFHQAWLQRQPLQSNLPQSSMAEIPFGLSGNSGTRQSISVTSIDNATIDNQNYMYVVNANYSVSGVSTGLNFHGLQIEYTMDKAAW